MFLTIKYNVILRYFVDSLYQAEKGHLSSSLPSLLRVFFFNHE